MRCLSKRNMGFTFIELIIVVAVLGILIPLTATLVINAYSYYTDILIINKFFCSISCYGEYIFVIWSNTLASG